MRVEEYSVAHPRLPDVFTVCDSSVALERYVIPKDNCRGSDYVSSKSILSPHQYAYESTQS
jgi:hypothetical protein